jgi:hypothetical protein
MHTSIIIEMEMKGHVLTFETASQSIYRAEYKQDFEFFMPSFAQLELMQHYVRLSREWSDSIDRK